MRLHDVFAQGLGFVLVFEYMISDLSEMIHNIDLPLMEDQVKSYMEMLLRGNLKKNIMIKKNQLIIFCKI